MKNPRVALVHDDLVQWGGAERVLAYLAELFPAADIYTSVLDQDNRNIRENFDISRIRVSFMQRIPFWRKIYRLMVFLYPVAFETFDFSKYDLVISQSTRFAKNILTRPETLHVCYCHTPPRFLWKISNQKSISRWLEPLLSLGRIIDQVSAKRVDEWLAGSRNSQQRIKHIYGVDSQVVYPFASEVFFEKRVLVRGEYFVVIARLVDYKNVDVVIEACKDLEIPLVVVGTGPEQNRLKKIADTRVKFVNGLSDKSLAELISKSIGVIVSAEEDFGLVSIEAQAIGKGVIAYGIGGSTETVVDGITGVMYFEQTKEALVEAITRFCKMKLNSKRIRTHAAKFGKSNFSKQFIDSLEKFGYSFS